MNALSDTIASGLADLEIEGYPAQRLQTTIPWKRVRKQVWARDRPGRDRPPRGSRPADPDADHFGRSATSAASPYSQPASDSAALSLRAAFLPLTPQMEHHTTADTDLDYGAGPERGCGYSSTGTLLESASEDEGEVGEGGDAGAAGGAGTAGGGGGEGGDDDDEGGETAEAAAATDGKKKRKRRRGPRSAAGAANQRARSAAQRAGVKLFTPAEMDAAITKAALAAGQEAQRAVGGWCAAALLKQKQTAQQNHKQELKRGKDASAKAIGRERAARKKKEKKEKEEARKAQGRAPGLQSEEPRRKRQRQMEQQQKNIAHQRHSAGQRHLHRRLQEHRRRPPPPPQQRE